MMWQRLNCALGRHSYINDPDFAPGDITAPATCACGATRAPIIWSRGPTPRLPSQPVTEQSFERAQIITAKAGDTIAVMSDAYMSANERLLLIALFQAKLPEGVKVMVLDRGMKLVHVEAGRSVVDEKGLAARWEHAARKQFECAERTDDSTGKRVMEHGATVYSNCASELRSQGASSPQP